MQKRSRAFLRLNVTAALILAGAWGPRTAAAAIRAYIPVQGSNSVKVIGAANGAVIATIKVGNKPTGVAVDSHHAVVYVSNFADDTVSAINANDNTVFSTIHTGHGPYGLAVAPDGSMVYVAESGDNTLGYFTALTPAATNNSTIAVSLVLHIPVGASPRGVAVTSDGKSVAVSNFSGNTVSVFDRPSQKIVATVATGRNPLGISATAAPPLCLTTSSGPVCQGGYPSRIEVANSADNTVSIISSETLKVVSTITVGKSPLGTGTFPFPTETGFVTNQGDSTLGILSFPLDGAPWSESATVPVGTAPLGVDGHPDGTRVYVSNTGGDSVSVVDAQNQKVVKTIKVGQTPAGLGQFVMPLFREGEVDQLFRPQADLAIKAKQGGAAPQFLVKNLGPHVATDVTFTDTLPGGVAFIAAKASQGGCVNPPFGSTGTTVRCSIGVLNPGETASIQMSVNGAQTANTVSVSSAWVNDPVGANNSVTVEIGTQGVSIELPSPPPPPPLSPPILTYQQTGPGPMVINGGQQRADNVRATMLLPNEGVYVDPVAYSLGCNVTTASPNNILSCPLQGAAYGECWVEYDGVTCEGFVWPAIVYSLYGHDQAYAVFPLDVTDIKYLATEVVLGISTDTPTDNGAGLFPYTYTTLLGQAAFVANANQLFPKAFPKPSKGCSTDLDVGFGALLDPRCKGPAVVLQNLPTIIAADLLGSLGVTNAIAVTVLASAMEVLFEAGVMNM